jgi:hypothetical protein
MQDMINLFNATKEAGLLSESTKITRRFTIKERLSGTPQRYYVGQVINSEGKVIATHTSKDRNYLSKTLRNKC